MIGEESINEENDKNIMDINNKDKMEFLSSLDNISLNGDFKMPQDFNKILDIQNSEISI